jgi:hypothetical protein
LEVEIQERLRREGAERELPLTEIELREQELDRLDVKDSKEGERNQFLAGCTQILGEAVNNFLWKFPLDAGEIPEYFDHIESLFDLYKADDDVESKLLRTQLN